MSKRDSIEREIERALRHVRAVEELPAGSLGTEAARLSVPFARLLVTATIAIPRMAEQIRELQQAKEA